MVMKKYLFMVVDWENGGINNMSDQDPTYEIYSIFPCPIYTAKRDLFLSLEEKKDIEDVISGGMERNFSNSISENLYIFNSKLKKIKQFCEQHIKIYAEQIIKPTEDLDFYITQSWLNVNKPGEYHRRHNHQNSIISGVFYVQTVEDDKIVFTDPNIKLKEFITFGEEREFNLWNSSQWKVPVNNTKLILFPSWLEHQVEPNQTDTTDRISLAFNCFVRGFVGNIGQVTELTLK